MHVIAAKAVAFYEALQPEFKQYSAQVIANARAMTRGSAASAATRSYQGGTDNHLFLLDLYRQKHHREGRRRLARAALT